MDQQEIWLRGTRLGIVVVVLFVAGALLAYLLTGLIGVSGSIQALIAICVGPFIGGIVFFVWWKAQAKTT